MHVDRVHQRFLRHAPWPCRPCRRRRCRACRAGTSRRPSSGTVSSTQSTIESEGFSIVNIDLFSEPPPLAATVTSTVLPGDELDVHDGRRVVAGVLPGEQRVRDDRGAQPIVGSQRSRGARLHPPSPAGRAFVSQRTPMPAFTNTLTMPVSWQIGRRPFGAHARIRQDLGDGVLCRGRLLARVGAAEVLDVVGGVVVGDELQGVSDALHEVGFTDQGPPRPHLITGGMRLRGSGRCSRPRSP